MILFAAHDFKGDRASKGEFRNKHKADCVETGVNYFLHPEINPDPKYPKAEYALRQTEKGTSIYLSTEDAKENFLDTPSQIQKNSVGAIFIFAATLLSTHEACSEILFKSDFASDGPYWHAQNTDDYPAQVLKIEDGHVYVRRMRAGGNGGGAFFVHELQNISVSENTILEIESNPISRSVADGCGFKCSEHPATVILLGRDAGNNEIRQTFGINYGIGDGTSDAQRGLYKSIDQGTTQTVQFNLSDAPKKLTHISKIYVGGSGWDFEARINSVVLRNESISAPSPNLGIRSLHASGETAQPQGLWMANSELGTPLSPSQEDVQMASAAQEPGDQILGTWFLVGIRDPDGENVAYDVLPRMEIELEPDQMIRRLDGVEHGPIAIERHRKTITERNTGTSYNIELVEDQLYLWIETDLETSYVFERTPKVEEVVLPGVQVIPRERLSLPELEATEIETTSLYVEEAQGAVRYTEEADAAPRPDSRPLSEGTTEQHETVDEPLFYIEEIEPPAPAPQIEERAPAPRKQASNPPPPPAQARAPANLGTTLGEMYFQTNVNVRSGAGSENPILGVAGVATRATVLARVNDQEGDPWYYVRTEDGKLTGYVFFTLMGPTVPTALPNQTSLGKAYLQRTSNLRRGPGTSHPVLEVGEKGIEVTLLERAEAEDGAAWFRVSVNEGGVQGYVHGKLLGATAPTPDPTASDQPAPDATPAPQAQANRAAPKIEKFAPRILFVTRPANVRTGPGKDNPIKFVSHARDILISTGGTKDVNGFEWFLIKSISGREGAGFIHRSSVSTKPPASSE